jgi:hypothetical protein
MSDLLRIRALVRIRYRVWKLRALLWVLRRLMVRAERLGAGRVLRQ